MKMEEYDLMENEVEQKQKCEGCGKKIVHPKRKYAICLDCIAQVLWDKGIVTYDDFKNKRSKK